MESTKRERCTGAPWWLLAFLFSLGCGGCSDSRPAESFVVALESMPQSLDPRFATDAASSRIGELVFRSLTRVDRNQQHVPDLALDWKLEGGRDVVFSLRKDVVFHDGSPLTAADVKATYDSILDVSTGSPKRQLLEFLEAVDAPDPHTVRFRMKEPFAPFLEATGIGILPRAKSSRPDADLVGSGPFRIAAVEPNHEIRLAAAAGHAGLPEIRFRVIPDETVRALEVRKSTVHFVQNGIEPENLRWLQKETGVCVRQTPGTTFQYVGIHLGDPILSDRRVREALALAIDRKGLVDHLLNGTARPATGLLAPSHWAYEPEVREYGYDPARARALLDEAVHPDPDADGPLVRFRLSYKTTTLGSRKRIAEALQSMLAAVGIGLDIRTFDWGTFYGDIRRGDFQLYGLAWVGVSDPDIYYTILASGMTPPRGNNRGHFANAELDLLTERARHTLDPRERKALYSRVQKLVAVELPFIPLWWEDNVVVLDRRLCGFVSYPDGGWTSLRTAWWHDERSTTGGGRGPGPCGCDVPGPS